VNRDARDEVSVGIRDGPNNTTGALGDVEAAEGTILTDAYDVLP
jgi:hypothetical protein